MGILKKNVFIVSARRSGTHLVSDLIINNFGFQRIGAHIDYDFLTHENVNEYIETMKSGGKLAWSHFHNFKTFFDRELSSDIISDLKEIFYGSKIILVYRDPRDIITSDYYRERNQKVFSDFKDYYYHNDKKDYTTIVNNPDDNRELFEIIKEYYRNWFSVCFAKELLGLDIEIISFEKVITDYENVVTRLSEFLETDVPHEIKDVRLTSLDDEKPDIEYSHHDFRAGRIGDWKQTFGEEWGEKLNKEYQDDINYHMIAYYQNPVLHENHVPERNYFQIERENWKAIEDIVDTELIEYRNEFQDFESSHDVNDIIENRYRHQTNHEVRFYHKVFYINKFVLKFMYPCKAALDKRTFDYVIPIASKQNLLTTLKTHEMLYDLNIAPKLHYAGIYKNIFVAIQEKLDDQHMIYQHPLTRLEYWWEWMIDTKLFPVVLEIYSNTLKHNILLKDISPHNFHFRNGVMKYVDLDGIRCFDSQHEMLSSKDYLETIDFLQKNNRIWEKKFGEKIAII